MKISKILAVLCTLAMLPSCTQGPRSTTETGYPSGEIQRPQVMVNDVIYYCLFTSEDLPEGYVQVGAVEKIDNRNGPDEHLEGSRVNVGDAVYALQGPEPSAFIYVYEMDSYRKYAAMEQITGE